MHTNMRTKTISRNQAITIKYIWSQDNYINLAVIKLIHIFTFSGHKNISCYTSEIMNKIVKYYIVSSKA